MGLMRQKERKKAAQIDGAEAPVSELEAAPEPPDAPAPENSAPPPGGPALASPEKLAGAVEAILLTLERPATPAKIAEALRLAAREGESGKPESPAKQVERAIDELNGLYEQSGRSFRIERVAGGVRVMTTAEFAPAVGAFQAARTPSRLSKPAVETLAIIAYRQPITRAEMESIRGVACGEVLKTLLERRLVEITGRAEEVGRPMLYGTTRRFLEQFGLASLKDLPSVGDLTARAPVAEEPAEEAGAEPSTD